MANSLKQSVLNLVLPKVRGGEGVSVTRSFNESAPNAVLSGPTYREHQDDIFATRSALDSKTLIQQMLVHDPDMSASLNAFLTVSNTEPVFIVRKLDNTLDEQGQKVLQQLLIALTVRNDYSTGFDMPRSLSSLSESARYMLLMRGGVAGELIINKEFFPSDLRFVDLGTLEWKEPRPGRFIPQQRSSTGKIIDLNIPSFFTAWFRKDPTSIFSYSPFVSAITTIAARQQVINDLYRIMKITGYPRMEAIILEEVLTRVMPPDIQQDPKKKATFIQQVIGNLQNKLSSLRPDQAFIHTDSIEVKTMNEKSAGITLDISQVISTLNSQNQAGLKTMATIIGRGESGVNTASVEARIFSLSAQAVNEPIAEFYSQAFTLALRLKGVESFVEVYFKPVEMRSDTELETQNLVRSQRLKEDLSLGLITDMEYHLWVYNRLPPEGVPKLSGTKFNTVKPGVDSTNISPNGDPVGKAAAAPGGNKAARDNKSKVKNA